MYNSKLSFHFIGIGGSGMSGLAEVLMTKGFRVSGSDAHLNSACRRLLSRGAAIFEGHQASHIPLDASLVVFSSAVLPSNPEILEAQRRGLPVVRRAEVLAELMRLTYGVAVAGSHGKTTTTSMTGWILEQGGLDPTVIIGGQVKSTSLGARVGKSDFLVAESDESDRSFLLLKPTIAVVTNIDAEHLVAYSSMQDLENSFASFVSSVPFYGLAVLCIDDPRVRSLSDQVLRRRCTFGLSPDADIRAVDLVADEAGTSFSVLRKGVLLGRTRLPMLGSHLVSNSLAAIAVALEFGISPTKILECLSSFPGVERRLEVVGVEQGVTVMTDYGHHPTEVRATIQAIRDGYGASLHTLWVVFQPHRYSRTRDCFVAFLECFRGADRLVLTEIYNAGEDPIEGVSGQSLFAALQHPHATFVHEPSAARGVILPEVSPGDVVLCLGAGSIGGLAQSLVEELRGVAAQRMCG